MSYKREEDPGIAQHDVRAEATRAAESGQDTAVQRAQETGDNLDTLTKDQLLEEAERRGVEVKTSSSKQEILDALRG